MRTCAQLVSYEVSLALSVLGVVIMGQSLSLVDIVSKQDATIWFVVPQFVGLRRLLHRGHGRDDPRAVRPARGRQELVAGYHTEYGGMRWGLFQMAEYINMITLSALAVTLFLGGWHGPVLDCSARSGSCSSWRVLVAASSGSGRRCRACATTS